MKNKQILTELSQHPAISIVDGEFVPPLTARHEIPSAGGFGNVI
jgi:hypothetical protein